MITIEILEQLSPSISPELVEQAVRAALTHQNAPADAELTVVLSNDIELRELNLQWMGVNAPTDVLSFPAEEIDPETGARYLGDVIISVETALRQAARAGHSLEAEVQLLAVHGVLHLLGHDHATDEEKARMWAAQSEILNQLGLGQIQVREE
ncbi:MAG: rRNA maturation RNase YbeY [Anaerolineales bacterium]|nr:rRNA maturation RNase YbeY [Anaerolineales bacterium]MCX7755065.1 rRNA maturation RNase YbeY [Anaerolineales bacterium]MDW8277582.1 rRNA maturation RNase YbeY [Anaerolineales bacterium]